MAYFQVNPNDPPGKQVSSLVNQLQIFLNNLEMEGGVGEPGEKGEKGDTGDPGATGPQGSPGPKGDPGDPGPAGVDGYTPIKGVDYFDGADGLPGADGSPGPKGDPGDTGPAGADGVDGTFTLSAISGIGTIPSTGWVANTGDYPYKIDVAISDVTVNDIVDTSIAPNDADIVFEAEICPTIDSYDGGITIYAKRVPTASISFTYMIVAPGTGSPIYANKIDVPPSSPHSKDDEFSGSSLDAKWTQLYKGTNDTIAVESGHLVLECPLGTQHRILGVVQPTPADSYSSVCQFNIESLSWNFFGLGLMVRNSSNEKTVWCGLISHSNFGMYTGYAQRLNGETFFAETDLCNFQNQTGYFKLDYDHTTGVLTWSISVTGVRFRKMWSCNISDFIGATPDQIGIMIHPWDDTGSGWGGLATFDWFRVTE